MEARTDLFALEAQLEATSVDGHTAGSGEVEFEYLGDNSGYVFNEISIDLVDAVGKVDVNHYLTGWDYTALTDALFSTPASSPATPTMNYSSELSLQVDELAFSLETSIHPQKGAHASGSNVVTDTINASSVGKTEVATVLPPTATADGPAHATASLGDDGVSVTAEGTFATGGSAASDYYSQTVEARAGYPGLQDRHAFSRGEVSASFSTVPVEGEMEFAAGVGEEPGVYINATLASDSGSAGYFITQAEYQSQRNASRAAGNIATTDDYGAGGSEAGIYNHSALYSDAMNVSVGGSAASDSVAGDATEAAVGSASGLGETYYTMPLGTQASYLGFDVSSLVMVTSGAPGSLLLLKFAVGLDSDGDNRINSPLKTYEIWLSMQLDGFGDRFCQVERYANGSPSAWVSYSFNSTPDTVTVAPFSILGGTGVGSTPVILEVTVSGVATTASNGAAVSDSAEIGVDLELTRA